MLLKVTGTGTVFLLGGGTIMEKVLAPGEALVVDTHSVVGFTESVQYGTQKAGDCTAMCCGGEGLFNTLLTGPGLVIVQSMSKERLRAAINYPASNSHSQANGGGGQGA